MESYIPPMEQIKTIMDDILQKISDVKEGSDAHKFLLIKKKILDDSLQKIIDEAQINKYEYELYTLFEKRQDLLNKINTKEYRSKDDDEDVKMIKEINSQMHWIRKTKLKDVKITHLLNNNY